VKVLVLIALKTDFPLAVTRPTKATGHGRAERVEPGVDATTPNQKWVIHVTEFSGP
jgi:hypothetical protein